MTERAWKRTERRVAAVLGGQRIPITGRKGPDVSHPLLAIEVKHRAVLPQWLRAAVAQAVACAGRDQLPVAVLHEAGQHHSEHMVVLRLRDFRGIFGTDGLAAASNGPVCPKSLGKLSHGGNTDEPRW